MKYTIPPKLADELHICQQKIKIHRETILEGGEGYNPHEAEELLIIDKIIKAREVWIAENFEKIKAQWNLIIRDIDTTSMPEVSDARKIFSYTTGIDFRDLKQESDRRKNAKN